MREQLRFIGLSLIAALATSGCAQMGHFLAALDTKPRLEAWGPGIVFPSIETAAVDALIYAYLQARSEQDLERMRAGTIYSVETGYSYGEIHVASNLLEHRIAYPLKPQDVARFHMYPFARDIEVNSGNERASQTDRRSVAVMDPLHRPLFILHPSLVIREYRGRDDKVVAVADLRRPKRVILIAGELD
ncbi:MAG: hypothetical protein IH885_08540 [Myxococcales bacterium]|nr:hypothetical protein [Myxococcales bacterium]